MKKILFTLILGLLAAPLSALAQEDHSGLFERAEAILESSPDCKTLSEVDLEALGEYFMEQMHPGEQHEAMDAMMGGEGSESLRLAHVNMGQAFYCGEGMMGGMMGSGMMRGGMMGYSDSIPTKDAGNVWFGMMDNNSKPGMLFGMHSGYASRGFLVAKVFMWITWPLFILLLILANILLWKKIKERKNDSSSQSK